MKIFSTFSGIGGFEIGIQNAYRSAERTRQGGAQADEGANRGRLYQKARQSISAAKRLFGTSSADRINERPLFIGYSEIDKHASKIYQKRFGGKNYGDITKIKAEELPDFECLIGGFPCQAFSIAGNRRGFDDTRGTLFFDLARILRAKQPRLFVFENVKGLLSHDNGNTFKTIIATIDELGYDAQWQVINSKYHGVPQNRERIIIVGHLRGTPRPQIFPIGQAVTNGTKSNSPEKASIAGTLTARMFANWSGNHIAQPNTPTHSNDRIYAPTGISPTLNTMQGGRRQPLIALSGNENSNGAPPDTAGMREVAGLSRPVDTMSDTQRYKMAGNAVTTNVIQAVFEKLLA